MAFTSKSNEPFELLLSSEVVEAARDHPEVVRDDPEFIERARDRVRTSRRSVGRRYFIVWDNGVSGLHEVPHGA